MSIRQPSCVERRRILDVCHNAKTAVARVFSVGCRIRRIVHLIRRHVRSSSVLGRRISQQLFRARTPSGESVFLRRERRWLQLSLQQCIHSAVHHFGRRRLRPDGSTEHALVAAPFALRNGCRARALSSLQRTGERANSLRFRSETVCTSQFFPRYSDYQFTCNKAPDPPDGAPHRTATRRESTIFGNTHTARRIAMSYSLP